MTRLILAAALAAGCTLASSAPSYAAAAARHYDCSKPGNANKAVCKSAAAAPKAATVAKPRKATRAEARPAKTARATTAAATKPTRPGLFQRMSNAISGRSKPAAPARPAAAPRRTAAAAPASLDNRNPAGAIAQCKDGMYSHAKTRSGACSRHGGVARWS